jgi:uncharacterized protein YifE (UPF0438 family)
MDMNEKASFICDSKFYGDKHFPYGLSRSGEFTFEQAALLETHGHAYEALYKGERQPETTEEQQFVAVFKGEREAQTAHEKAWTRFLAKIREKHEVSAFGRARSSKIATRDNYTDEYDD